MGGCIAKDIKRFSLSERLSGVVSSSKRIKDIKRYRLFDEVTDDLALACKDSQLIILACPVEGIINYLKVIKKHINKGAIVTDIGSTKAKIMSTAEKYLPDNFIGSHPLCGAEKKGIKNSTTGIFKNNLCLVVNCKKNKKNLPLIMSFWKALGSQVEVISALEHDKVLSYTSHLPHLIAFSLMSIVPNKFLKYAAGSFKDLTRISGSDALLWENIFSSNKKNVNDASICFWEHFNKLAKLLQESDNQNLIRQLKKISRKRNLFYGNSN